MPNFSAAERIVCPTICTYLYLRHGSQAVAQRATKAQGLAATFGKEKLTGTRAQEAAGAPSLYAGLNFQPLTVAAALSSSSGKPLLPAIFV